jgi:flagellar motor switch protein FliN/FliY
MNEQTQMQADDNAAADWADALAEQAAADTAATAGAARPAAPGAASAEAVRMPPLKAPPGAGLDADGEGERNLDVILDIPVTLSMEIGRTRLPIRNLLQLNQGSVVELERLAGEPMDVLVNGTLIARGEVVVINERYGIRLTDVISPAERVRKLR